VGRKKIPQNFIGAFRTIHFSVFSVQGTAYTWVTYNWVMSRKSQKVAHDWGITDGWGVVDKWVGLTLMPTATHH